MNHFALQQKLTWGFPGGTVLKKPPANSGDTRDLDLIPGLEKSPGEGNDNLFQHSCLENSKDKGAWWATDHRVTKSQTKLGTLWQKPLQYCKVISLQLIKINLKKKRAT